MQALSFAGKARLIVCVFAVPIAILGGEVVNRLLENHRFTVQERGGVQLLQSLSTINRQLLSQREAAQAANLTPPGNGAAPQGFAAHALQDAAEQAKATALLPHLQTLQTAAQTLTGASSLVADEAQTRAAQGLELVARVGDLSGLILDPDIDTLYLSLLAIQVLPAMADDLSNLRAWSRYLNATPRMTAAQRNLTRQQYAVWDAGLRSNIKRYQAYVQRVVAYRPDTAANLPLDFLERLQTYRLNAYALAMQAPEAGDDAATALWVSGQAVQDDLQMQYSAVLPLLDALLQKRLDDLWRTNMVLLIGTVLALLTATYFFFAFYEDSVRDMAQKQLDEAQLRAAKEAAEKANAAKSDFLANMSHEIRTPMNGVIGMTDLALELSQDATQREFIQTVKDSAASLLIILNDILDFSKIEAGQLRLENIAFDPRALFTGLGQSLRARLESKQLSFMLDVSPELPPSVLGDPGRLRQVLNNLSDNAIKFTAQGGLTLRVSAGDSADEWHFAMRDTGIGIPAEKQKLIFDAFSQADASTTREFGGSGLGLTICARLVGMMGGRIWVESMTGQGSTFHFTVNMPQATAAPVAVLSEPGPVHAPSRNVLLVEDHPVNQILARTLLERAGHTVTLAENGQQAVELFGTAHWDLILMDLQMPVMGGIEAARQIRAMEVLGTRVPIIAVTANAMEADRCATELAGMDAHLAKPIDKTILLEMLTRFTRRD